MDQKIISKNVTKFVNVYWVSYYDKIHTAMNVLIIFGNIYYTQNKNICSCFLLENQVLYLHYN
jgi:hypothetical protein